MLIGITGGIGSGKSVVSRVLRVMDYPVYDTDARAKQLMNESVAVRQQLIDAFGAIVYEEGVLNRTYLANRIFTSPQDCQRINSIIHPAVTEDLKHWVAMQQCEKMFVESAILLECELKDAVDAVWLVTAPMDVRIARVMQRNSCTRQEVLNRINSQMSDDERKQHGVAIINNDGKDAVIPQILQLLQ